MNPRRAALDAAAAVGAGPTLLRAYDAVVGLKEFPVGDDIRAYDLDPEERDGRILVPLLPGYASWAWFACVLGHAFRTRGYEPLLLRCGGVVEPCPAETVDDSGPGIRTLCDYYGRYVPALFGLETVTAADFGIDPEGQYDIPPVDDAETRFVRNGVDLSGAATASSRKYLKRYHVDYDDPAQRTVYESFLRSAARLLETIERAFERHDIALTLVYEPYYVHGRVPLAATAERGVPARTVGTGFVDQSLVFGSQQNRSALQEFSETDAVERHLSTPLTDDQRDRVETVMRDRESGANVPHHFTSTTEQSVETGSRPTVGMFTNLVWDASLEPDHGSYADVFEWLVDTLDHFCGRDDVSLVVKTHPAEAARGTKESVAEWVREHYAPLPDHITLLPSDTDVNTYELFADLNAGVVFNSTVGLEMAYRGYPVVVGGDTHYRGFGFTFDPSGSVEYLDLLESIEDLDCDAGMEERATRYAYFLFCRKHINFPFFRSRDDDVDYEFLPVEHTDLAPGAEPFDTVVASLLADEPVLQPGTADHPQLSDSRSGV